MIFCVLLVTLIFSVSADSVDTKDKITSEQPLNASEEVCKHDPIIEAINDFSGKIANKIKTDGNLFYSPFSIYSVLAMAELGAGGKTKAEMRKVLGYQDANPQESDIYNEFCKLISMLKESHGQYDLFAANALLMKENFSVIVQYVENLKECFDADVKNVNFGSSEGTQIINSWISEKTNEMIPKLFDSNLDPSTCAVLLNAIYFKGTWETQFPKKETHKGMFYNGKNEKAVKMMLMRSQKFLYWTGYKDPIQFLKMPYKGEHIAVIFALPLSRHTPANLSMNHDLLCRINSNLRLTELSTIMIPKFNFEHTEEMVDVLIDLGMKELFTQAANLTGITKEIDVYVSSVFHKAFIEVDEEGSKAAAGSGFVLMAKSYEFTFIADHPFNFFIMDERNGMVLFSGRVTDP